MNLLELVKSQIPDRAWEPSPFEFWNCVVAPLGSRYQYRPLYLMLNEARATKRKPASYSMALIVVSGGVFDYVLGNRLNDSFDSPIKAYRNLMDRVREITNAL